MGGGGAGLWGASATAHRVCRAPRRPSPRRSPHHPNPPPLPSDDVGARHRAACRIQRLLRARKARKRGEADGLLRELLAPKPPTPPPKPPPARAIRRQNVSQKRSGADEKPTPKPPMTQPPMRGSGPTPRRKPGGVALQR